ncbi:hypothetical protein DUZ99_01970 [Xylanibacillus composti]|uniref:Uncharacterized protein n=1 Tax=Xylanibacillus composti TaxID=1572762 RepID=A0A8J4M3D3_9BACL|nr:DUF6173 family protein [Xylanibacillus composti]MDT9723761.1 hypothetical protein [Xylanibacillus composti]GIQ70770.1 hypothetical protein XYCOK13_35940 [Xylanibacillus composti]
MTKSPSNWNSLDSIKVNIDNRNYHLADRQYEIIMESIREFESELDDDLEVAVQLAAFGQSVVMHVTALGYSNPSLIHFYGYVNGVQSELIQHINQLSFLLTSVPKKDPNKPARRIGYIQEDN